VTDLAPRPAAAASASVPRPAAAPKPAAALHNRAKPSHVLDLRPTPSSADTPATPVTHTTHTPAALPKSTAHERHIAQFTDRFDRAKQFSRSPHVSRFADNLGHLTAQALTTTNLTPAELRPTDEPPGLPHYAPARTPATGTLATSAPATSAPAASREMPHQAVAQHQAMARLAVPQSPPPAMHTPAPTAKPAYRPHLSLSPHAGRLAAISATVAILGGYVWLQNYPKLALQAASNRAGLTASLPGYVPSSYNLARTDTAPGLVTLRFTSPSLPDTLKIAQAKTAWDSSSLLDNYIIRNADDYTTVQGQGLTIYLWGNNQAAWVNHGIWYSIEGATRLSREQILKIAYSL
jgi:hypothetical protein